MPTTAKIPTHKSSSLRVIMTLQSSEHQCRQYEIERENCKRRGHYRARGRARHALRGRWSIVSLEYRDPAHCHPKHQTLDEAVQDVLAKIDGRLHLRPERAFVDSDEAHAHEVAAEYPHRRKQGRKQGHGDHTS